MSDSEPISLPTQLLRVLIVEDTEERQKVLTNLYRAHAWVLVNTALRAIAMVKAYEFDIISLDYNLRGDLDGNEVANAILHSQNSKARVVIHSMNPRGANELSQILPSAVQYPVSKMIRSNKVFKHLKDEIDRLGISFSWDA